MALKHRLVSRHTSLVAVEEIIARMPADEVKTSAIPNLVAQGQVAMFPNTATNATFTFILGLVGVLITCYPFDAIQTGGPLRYVVTARRRE